MSSRDFNRIAQVEGWEHFERASENGNGVIIVHHHIILAHLNWVYLKRQGLADLMVTIGKEWSHPIKSRDGNASTNTNKSPSELKFDFLRQLQSAKQVLKKGGVVRILPDGFRGDSAAMSFPFFSRLQEFRPSFAVLALMTGAEIIPASTSMDSAGRFTISFHQPLRPLDRNDNRKNVAGLVAAYVKYVEQQWQTSSLRFISISTLKKFLQLPPADAKKAD